MNRQAPLAGLPLLVRRAWWAAGWFGIGLVIYLSLMRNPPSIPVEQGDKLEHIAAYAMLMFWFAHLDPDRRRRQWMALALLALGVGLEFVQGMTDYREFSVADMAADAIGIGGGWLLAPPRLPSLLAFAQRVAARIAPSA